VTKATRVLVADAHLPTRTGIRLLLERSGFEVCAEAANADAAVAAAQREQPEICLVDADLPGGGILATARISSQIPSTDVVVIASTADEDGVANALHAGASGYLPADSEPQGMVRALRAVRRGEAVVPRNLLGPLVEHFRVGARGRRLTVPGRGEVELTRRQSEVLSLLRDGLGTAEIARHLGLAPVTVRRHVGLVLEKLGATDRAAALRLIDEGERGKG
jgi:DNA-binding NarL/FixJ family response regulator